MLGSVRWRFIAYISEQRSCSGTHAAAAGSWRTSPSSSSYRQISIVKTDQRINAELQLGPFKMHISVINGPMRNAVLGARMSSATLAPFSCSTTISASPLPSFQNRAASTVSRCRGVIPFNQQQPALLKSRPQRQAQQQIFLTTALRNTSIRANSTSTTSTSKASASPQAGDGYLDWNSFFKLRASRRRYSLASSILSSIATTAIGVQILSTQDLENLGAQVMGLDPFVVLGMATAACGAIGLLVGPFLGNAVWGLIYRRYKPAVQVVRALFPLSHYLPACYELSVLHTPSSY